ncbi:hypothetical protein GBN32_01910 [Plesiomonas shigelloides]|uniref:hypothetical protein n=1 Tax=Plesiomonas shigelloides TaxID=703 RepID=UPI00126164A3|nr:hypothetical protein [Plesiomonas shigelloides]KAB7714819.1 hypothetical protein GBN32_01910 [Plesiomonas shigelloides]
MDDISDIEKKLISFSEKHATPSTTKRISKLLTPIENAIADGLTLDLITSFLNQQGIKISKNTLKVILYRLRKRKSPPIKSEQVVLTQHAPIHSTENKLYDTKQQRLSPKEQTEFDDLTRKIESFNAATGWVDRYVALGGDVNDIKDQSESQKRQMTMQLKSSISRKLQLYKY